MSYIQSRDATLYYEEYGSGEPLILIPGLLCTIESHWRRFIPDLAKCFHTIAVDLRGHGKTNNPSGILRLETFVADLHTLYDTLQIDQAYLCGHDLGGLIGLAYGIEHPETVRGLFMHASKVFWTDGSVRPVLDSLENTEPLHRFHAKDTQSWSALLQATRQFIELMPQETVSEALLPLATFRVCVSIGDNDETISRQEAERLVRLLPRATLVVLENAGHSLHTVQKSIFVEHIRSFFLSDRSTQRQTTTHS